jgi:putative endonuclease
MWTRLHRLLRSADIGAAAEQAALAHLRAAGLVLIERNWRCRGGEIDLVMREGDTLVFVEVRHRSASSHGDGLDSVGANKRKRLRTAIAAWLAAHPAERLAPVRIDVLAAGAGGLRWIRGAIEDGRR